MSGEPRKVAATCRICGHNLTVEEFRACAGVGHYCSVHHPGRGKPAEPAREPGKTQARPRTKSVGRGRRLSESGAMEYTCKAQFAKNGVIRSGKLTSDHPSCLAGDVVFVYNGIGYGPGEIATLFIPDAQGRRLAERAGYECRA